MIDVDAKTAVDAASILTGVASLAGWLPAVASLFTIIWLAIRIYESATVQRWLGK